MTYNNNDNPEITRMVECSKRNAQRRRLSIFLGIFLSLIVVGLSVLFVSKGSGNIFSTLTHWFSELLFSIKNNPLAWIMGGVLVLITLMFVFFLPKRKNKKKTPMTTARIAEIGVITAAVAVVYLTTAWLIDAILPYIGCVARTIAVAVFLSGVRHYKWWELFLITTLALVITLIIIPCPINTIAIPISMAFVLVYGLLRRHTPPWLAITLGTFVAYIVMIASIAFINPSEFWHNFTAALGFSWALLIVIPLIIWWRTRKNEQVSCQGCDKDCDQFSLGKN